MVESLPVRCRLLFPTRIAKGIVETMVLYSALCALVSTDATFFFPSSTYLARVYQLKSHRGQQRFRNEEDDDSTSHSSDPISFLSTNERQRWHSGRLVRPFLLGIQQQQNVFQLLTC